MKFRINVTTRLEWLRGEVDEGTRTCQRDMDLLRNLPKCVPPQPMDAIKRVRAKPRTSTQTHSSLHVGHRPKRHIHTLMAMLISHGGATRIDQTLLNVLRTPVQLSVLCLTHLIPSGCRVDASGAKEYECQSRIHKRCRVDRVQSTNEVSEANA